MKKLIILFILCLFLFGCATKPLIDEKPKVMINNFEECVNAGNPVMESYPRKCRANNKTFVENITIEEPVIITEEKITLEELAKHSTEQDCWIVYEGKVYDFTDTKMHPNMAKAFYSHCGKLSFEEAAKARHSISSESRVDNYGEFVGVLE